VGGGSAYETEFVFDNRGADPVLLGGDCGLTWPTLSLDQAPLVIDGQCACSCEQFDSPEGCPDCPTICLSTAELAVPGVALTRGWDGLVLSYERESCHTLEAPGRGALLTAHACHDVVASDDLQCVRTDFAYGIDREVTFRATPGSQRAGSQRVVIENQTGVPIELVVDRCGVQVWFELADEDARIATNAFCPCSCDDGFQPEGCPACGACAEEQVTTLANGESHALDWDGRFWYQYDSGCARNYAMPEFYGVLARVCYTKLGDGAPTCTAPRPLLRSNFQADTFVVTE
jgi:hypothetical protein